MDQTVNVDDPLFPFGAHKGLPMSAVPSGYMDWLLRVVWLGDTLRGAMLRELQRRGVQ